MARRVVAAALIAVVLATLFAGCSNDSVDPGTTSASASVVAPPTPSVAAVSTTSSTTAVPPSDTVTAAPSDGSSPPPWPSTLSADELTAAQGATAAYRSYWQTIDLAAAQPDEDWTQEVAQFAAGPEQQSLLEALRKLVERGYHTVGSTGISLRVTAVQRDVVAITDCVDKTATDSLDSNGKSVKAPDVAGSYFRHPSTAQVAQLADGRWAVVVTTDDWSQTC